MSRSHQSGPIAHGQHWNDAPPLQQIRSQSRSATPTAVLVSAAASTSTQEQQPSETGANTGDWSRDDTRLQSAIDRVLSCPNRLPQSTHTQLVGRIRATLDVSTLTDEAAEELELALATNTGGMAVQRPPEDMRKALVEYIRRHAADGPGVIRWVSALRNVAENVVVVDSHQ